MEVIEHDLWDRLFGIGDDRCHQIISCDPCRWLGVQLTGMRKVARVMEELESRSCLSVI
jgi:hypothetical protein